MDSEKFSTPPPNDAATAILHTLAFFDILHWPLTLKELHFFLIAGDWSEEVIAAVCARHPAVSRQEGLICLAGREDLFRIRKEHSPLLALRYKRIRRIVPLLRFIPFIREVYLCNNLSFGIATPTGDIDLFIVTEKDHLWLGRFLTTFFLHLLGVRRHHRKITNRFCLSFFVAEDARDLTAMVQKPQDIYLAFWLKGLVPIIITANEKSMLLANKKWLTNYFNITKLSSCNVLPDRSISPLRQTPALQRIQEWVWKTRPGRWLAGKITSLQRQRIQRSSAALDHREGIVATDSMLKFHNEDRRSVLQTAWQNRLLTLEKYDQKTDHRTGIILSKDT